MDTSEVIDISLVQVEESAEPYTDIGTAYLNFSTISSAGFGLY